MKECNLKVMDDINKEFLEKVELIIYDLCSQKNKLSFIFPEKNNEFNEDIKVLKSNLAFVTRKVSNSKMNIIDMINYAKRLEIKLKCIKEFVRDMQKDANIHLLNECPIIIGKILNDTEEVMKSLVSIEILVKDLGEFLVSTSIIKDLNNQFDRRYRQLIRLGEFEDELLYLNDLWDKVFKNENHKFENFDISAYSCEILSYRRYTNNISGVGIIDDELYNVYINQAKKQVICENEAGTKKIVIRQNLIGKLKIYLFIHKGFVRELALKSMEGYF